MKTPEQWSEQMVRVDSASPYGRVVIAVGGGEFALKSGACQQHARALREIVAAGLRAYGQELLANVARQKQLGALAARSLESAHADDSYDQRVPLTTDEGDKARSGRTLYGLPCSQCGSYFESAQTMCPVCGAAKEGSGVKAAETSAISTRAARPYAGEASTAACPEREYSADSLREGIGAEIVDACVQYGARLERMESALRMTPEQASKVIYEVLFAAQAKMQPWEQCPAEFRAGYVSRIAVLLQELRRRAGLEPLAPDSEFTIDAERGELSLKDAS